MHRVNYNGIVASLLIFALFWLGFVVGVKYLGAVSVFVAFAMVIMSVIGNLTLITPELRAQSYSRFKNFNKYAVFFSSAISVVSFFILGMNGYTVLAAIWFILEGVGLTKYFNYLSMETK